MILFLNIQTLKHEEREQYQKHRIDPFFFHRRYCSFMRVKCTGMFNIFAVGCCAANENVICGNSARGSAAAGVTGRWFIAPHGCIYILLLHTLSNMLTNDINVFLLYQHIVNTVLATKRSVLTTYINLKLHEHSVII